MAQIKTRVELQYADKSVSQDELIEKAKAAYEAEGGKKVKNLDIYVKPEENKAYYVVNNETTGSIDL